MAKIMVDPAKLKTAAGKMETLASNYESLYRQLYVNVDGMAKAWQGKDNIAYTTQIEGFRDDLDKMKKLMDEYSTFLRKSADAYTKTQEEIVSQARTLTN